MDASPQCRHATDEIASMVERRPGTGVAAVVLLVPGGTSAEFGADTGGEAHLIEHCTLRSWFALAEQRGRPFDLTGGSPQAHTTKEYWLYSVLVLRDDVELAVSTVLEAVAQPDFGYRVRAAEHSRITRELSLLRARPLVVEIDRVEREILAGTDLGRSEFDRHPSSPPSRDALVRCLERATTRGRPVLAIVGDIDEAEIGCTPGGDADELTPAPSRPGVLVRRPQGIMVRSSRANDQARLVIGSAAPAFAHDGSAAAATLAALLGSGYESELARESRESGLFYSPYAHYSRYRDAGTLVVGVVSAPTQSAHAERRLLRRLEAIAEGNAPERIHAARERLTATTILRLSDPLVAAQRLAVARHYTGRRPTGALRELEEVRPQAVGESARLLLPPAVRTIDVPADERTTLQ